MPNARAACESGAGILLFAKKVNKINYMV